MGRRRVYVLSDLHLGPGGALTTFHEPERLCSLLERWRTGDRIDELILAGDVFDFLQVEAYDGFDASRAAARFETLLAHPPTAAVLAGVKALAGHRGVELTVLSGNHDPELLVNDVRGAFEREVGRTGSVRWADDEALVPRDGDHPAVWGRAVHADEAAGDPTRHVWVVHGDRWDPANAIDRDAVRAASRDGTAVSLPVGSHLVFEVLSRLKVHHRWVDELKPELPVVVPLLMALAPRETAGYLTRHYAIAGRLFVAQVRAFLRSGDLFDDGLPGESGERDVPTVAARAIAAELASASRDAQDGFLAELERVLERGAPPPAGASLLSGSSGVSGLLLRAWLRLVRAVDRFGRLDGPDSMVASAHRYLPTGLGALVAGHTHGARIRADLSPPYFNSGTWMPVRTLPSDLQGLVATLTDAQAPRIPSPGTYVRIEVGDGQPLVAVEHAP